MSAPTTFSHPIQSGTHILLGVTGSIAAYKAVALCRGLQQRGPVKVLMTPSATRFVGKATFEGLTGTPVFDDLFAEPGEPHVNLAQAATMLVIAPATAHALAELATGLAGNAVTATALCFDGPVYVAPAMHPTMWAHPATQANARTLTSRGVCLLGPVDGPVASGDSGVGRMMDPDEMLARLPRFSGSLAGKHVVVTAGPTEEPIDPVRFLTNGSSGKMGYALADEAAKRGARVTLISGPVRLACPARVQRIGVRTTDEMRQAMAEVLQNSTDLLLMAAAVGDYRAASESTIKLPRQERISLELVGNPDLLAEVAHDQAPSDSMTIVAFAVETGDDAQVIQRATEKRSRKGADLIVANRADEALGKDTNRVHLIDDAGPTTLPTQSKQNVAAEILNWYESHALRDSAMRQV